MIALYYTAIRPQERHHDAGLRLLRWALARFAPEVPPNAPLEEAPGGKPRLADWPGIHFNLSHGGQWVVCALSREGAVGVDLEQERPRKPSIARKFTPQEQAWLSTQPESAFFDLWVKKEAFLKATGAGLTRRLDSFPVLPLAENTPEEGYCLRLLPFPEEGYHLALCAPAGSPPPQQVERLDESSKRTRNIF